MYNKRLLNHLVMSLRKTALLLKKNFPYSDCLKTENLLGKEPDSGGYSDEGLTLVREDNRVKLDNHVPTQAVLLPLRGSTQNSTFTSRSSPPDKESEMFPLRGLL